MYDFGNAITFRFWPLAEARKLVMSQVIINMFYEIKRFCKTVRVVR